MFDVVSCFARHLVGNLPTTCTIVMCFLSVQFQRDLTFRTYDTMPTLKTTLKNMRHESLSPLFYTHMNASSFSIADSYQEYSYNSIFEGF